MRNRVSRFVRHALPYDVPGRADLATQTAIVERIACAFSRAAATAAARVIDPTDLLSWEFAGFSQHGEDGIVDYLCRRMKNCNSFFFEIGSADGLENCTTWLSLARNYAGVMVEGDPDLSKRCDHMLYQRVWNVSAINCMVDPANVPRLMKSCPYKDPDVFVLDIDGIDYYVMKRVLELGYRPKIVVVEYNSAFGPEKAITVPYTPNFVRWQAHPTGLYYGASIGAWHKLLGQYRYKFLGVESSGSNGFFVDPAIFADDFVAAVRGVPFRNGISDCNGATRPYRDASGDLVVPARDWVDQFTRIADLEFVQV